MPEYYQPEYPAILLKAAWDKKKSVLAKAAGETGVGAQMAKTKAAYDRIDWSAADVEFQMTKVVGIRFYSEERLVEEAKKASALYASGAIRKFVDECFALRDVVKAAEAKFEKSKTIPKADTKLAHEIATTADHLGVANNANSFGGRAKEQMAAARNWGTQQLQEMGNRAMGFLKTAVDKAPGLCNEIIAAAKTRAGSTDAEERRKQLALVSQAMSRCARNFTQGLLNLEKGVKSGLNYPFETAEMIKLGHELTATANPQGSLFEDDIADSKLQETCKWFLAKAKRVDELYKKAAK